MNLGKLLLILAVLNISSGCGLLPKKYDLPCKEQLREIIREPYVEGNMCVEKSEKYIKILGENGHKARIASGGKYTLNGMNVGEAHAWVEVYLPKKGIWVSADPARENFGWEAKYYRGYMNRIIVPLEKYKDEEGNLRYREIKR